MKRIAAAGAAVVAIVAASGCGAVPESGVAARVGDEEVTVDQVESVMRGVSSLEGSGVAPDEATRTVDGDFARNVVSIFVTTAATSAFLSQNGESITDEDRQAVRESIPADDPGLEYPQDVLDLLVDLQAGQAARQRVSASPPEDLQARYEASPGDLGILCVRHVLLDDEAAAQAVVDELAAGASMEDLARQRSTDPSAADNGGAIELTAGEPCAPAAAMRQAIDATFVDAAMTAVPGEPVGPVQTDFGWHVIEARPYDEVAESLANVYETSGGELLFARYLEDLDVDVDPRYGRWDADEGAVVEL